MKTVIMAGGRGSRISDMTDEIPKPMIKVGGKPVLEHIVECLSEQGFSDIIMTVSYKKEVIIDYFGDGNRISPVTGKWYGVHIEYYIEEIPLGNAGALFEIKEELTDDFLLINADALFNVDLSRFVKFHRDRGADATLFAHPNSHPYDSGLLIIEKDGKVVRWLTKEDERPQYYANVVNAGLHILSPRMLNKRPDTLKVDLDRQILRPMAGHGELYAYTSPEYIKDMGTPERYRTVCDDFAYGIIGRKSLQNKQKAIFLDRDGTINKYVGFLNNIEDFELIEGVAEAIKMINIKGYLAIVITNQPVIARGEISEEGLEEIHNKMETLLGKEGAYIDAIYYCPHHPDGGYEGEIKKYKIMCECRKPKPGLLFMAAKEYNIDMSASWMIGDGENDIKAGKNAGCNTVLITSERNTVFENDENIDFGQDMTANSLLEAVETIIGKSSR